MAQQMEPTKVLLRTDASRSGRCRRFLRPRAADTRASAQGKLGQEMQEGVGLAPALFCYALNVMGLTAGNGV